MIIWTYSSSLGSNPVQYKLMSYRQFMCWTYPVLRDEAKYREDINIVRSDEKIFKIYSSSICIGGSGLSTLVSTIAVKSSRNDEAHKRIVTSLSYSINLLLFSILSLRPTLFYIKTTTETSTLILLRGGQCRLSNSSWQKSHRRSEMLPHRSTVL